MNIKRKPILYGFIIYFIFLNLFIGVTLANSSSLHISADDDGDGVDDDIEEHSLRNVNITLSSDHVEIESILRKGLIKDKIKFEIDYDINDGVCVEVYYNANSNQTTDYELQFEIIFQRIIEFLDLDYDGIYDPSIDNRIREEKLDSFDDYANYTITPISTNTTLHYLTLSSSDNIFIFHIYIAEEFTLINNSLLTPTQIKVDFEINNYIFNDNSSQLALYTQLKSRSNYVEVETTDDEKKGYSLQEKGVKTINASGYAGFFTWSESAYVDGILKPINASALSIDDDDLTEQKLYLNYPQGTFLYHTTKIGIASVYKSNLFVFKVIIFILFIGAVSTTVGYAIHQYRHKTVILKKVERKYTKGSIMKSPILTLFEEKNLVDKLIKKKDINITVITEDFLENIERFDWNEEDKQEFFKEMLSLTPKEREEILKEMFDSINDKN
ncbi:MAG: hypothetical protein ACFFA6_01065 [Promethearchaeota archaeon]